MNVIVDFLMGRSNKLLRDMLGMSATVAVLSVMATVYISATVDALRTSRQQLPPKIQIAAPPSSNNQVTTVSRSVLDDQVVTGSVPGRGIVLDPCTGKEKK